MIPRALAAAWFLVSVAVWIATPVWAAYGQHNHHRGHGHYKDWASERVGNCCSDDDCGELNDDELRETATGPEVKIAGQWCPVLRHHFIIRGKSPDASVPHACIGNRGHWLDKPPCERLLCFMGKAGI